MSPNSSRSLPYPWSVVRNRYLSGSCSLLLGLIGCDDSGAADAPDATTAGAPGELPAGHPATGGDMAADPHAGMEGMMGGVTYKGVVKETMNAAGYTYVNLVTCDDQLWFAAPEVEVAVGQVVEVPEGSLMSDFSSRTLGRSFEWIRFTSSVTVIDEELPCLGDLEQEVAGGATPAPAGDAEKVEGELTLEQIFTKTADYKGKQVTLRGEVVKYNEAIMGTNWIHLQDGSAVDDKPRDLTITTSDTAAVGDKVVVTGVLGTDRDFGAGYNYAVIVENASVKAQ